MTKKDAKDDKKPEFYLTTEQKLRKVTRQLARTQDDLIEERRRVAQTLRTFDQFLNSANKYKTVENRVAEVAENIHAQNAILKRDIENELKRIWLKLDSLARQNRS